MHDENHFKLIEVPHSKGWYKSCNNIERHANSGAEKSDNSPLLNIFCLNMDFPILKQRVVIKAISHVLSLSPLNLACARAHTHTLTLHLVFCWANQDIIDLLSDQSHEYSNLIEIYWIFTTDVVIKFSTFRKPCCLRFLLSVGPYTFSYPTSQRNFYGIHKNMHPCFMYTSCFTIKMLSEKCSFSDSPGFIKQQYFNRPYKI